MRSTGTRASRTCGCATGEEAYSTAILLREEGLAERCQIYATDLSARAVQHERGTMWRAVRASSSIAGLFAPVAWDGDLLVDGATMNNWPVDVMRQRCPAGTVIAVHVNPDPDATVRYDYGEHLSGFQALRHHLFSWLPNRPRREIPFIAGILTALSLVNDAMATQEKRALADILIIPDVKAFNPLNFGVARPLIDAGYAAAKATLATVSLPGAAIPHEKSGAA